MSNLNFGDIGMDVRYALRQLRRSPGFAAVAVLTLALGIGANTAIFSLLDAVELRQLPVRNPEQLVFLHWTAQRPVGWHRYSSYTGCDAKTLAGATSNCSFSYPVFDLFRTQAHSLDGIFAFAGPAGVQATIRGEIAHASAEVVSGEFFSTLGVPAWAGRTLTANDDQPGAEPVAVLSYTYWQDRFGSDPLIVGKTLALNGAVVTIVGVAPKEFFGLQPIFIPDMWIPVHSAARLGPGWWNFLDGQSAWLFAIGRLKPGVRPEQARAELEVLFRASLAANPQTPLKPEVQPGIVLTSAARGVAGLRMRYSRPLQVLMVVVALVLLIACANIANLLLARASSRRREIAVRLALGAGRARLLRQLLTEALLLACLGGAAGFFLAIWASRALVALLVPATEPTMLDVRADLFVFGFTAGVAGLTAVLFGLAPAVAGTRLEPAAELKSAGGIAGGGSAVFSRRSWLGRSLVAGEMAIALLLLVGAGLFLRTLVNLETLDPGFRKENLLIVETSPRHEYRGPAVRSAANATVQEQLAVLQGKAPEESAPYAALRARLAALPGVRSVTWSSGVLLVGNLETTGIQLLSRRDLGNIQVEDLRIGPHYFETMDIPILTGRNIQREDCGSIASAVWVNHALAKHYYPNRSPLGDRIPWGKGSLEIVGVVGDAKYESLRREIQPAIYVPSSSGRVFELRTAADSTMLASAVRQAIHDVAPNLLIDSMKSQTEQVAQALFGERMMVRLSAGFSLLALALAGIGIYGVLAYSVARRTGEIAIRMSLGAMPRDVLRLILTDGLSLALIGSVVGLLASYGLTRLVAAFLFGVGPLDLFTFVVATLLLLGVAALACYLPARRAMRVEPMAALRFD